MLNNITGSITLWINDFDPKDGKAVIRFFSTSVGNKQEDGSFMNAKLPVHFSKKVDSKTLENGDVIDIAKSWLSVVKGKNDQYPRVALFVDEVAKVTKGVKIVEDVKGEALLKRQANEEYAKRTANISDPAEKQKIQDEIALSLKAKIDALKNVDNKTVKMPF